MSHSIQGSGESGKTPKVGGGKGSQKPSPPKKNLVDYLVKLFVKVRNLVDQACFGSKAKNFEAVKQGLKISDTQMKEVGKRGEHYTTLANESQSNLSHKQIQTLSTLSNRQLRNIKTFIKNTQSDLQLLVPVVTSVRRELEQGIEGPKLKEFKESASGQGHGVHR